MCGLPYVQLEAENSIGLLAAPIMTYEIYESKPIYYSYIIVNKKSNLENFEDLRGKTFVYNDELSNSGYNMPRAKLIKMNETKGFFGKILKSGTHEESIRMVSEGKADVSAVDSLVLDHARLVGANYSKNVKIIEKLGPSAIPPVVYSKKLTPDIIANFQDVLVNMSKDEKGKEILKKIKLKEFTVIDDSNYDVIRKMEILAKEADFLEIK